MKHAMKKGTAPAHRERLFVVRPEHNGPGGIYDQRGGYETQFAVGDHEEDITYLVIGRETTDEQCESMAFRFGLQVAGLKNYRDSPRPLGPQEVKGWGALQ